MITKEEALTLKHGIYLYHTNYSPEYRVRVTGKVKTWKKKPEAFRIPVKHGMYGKGDYITETIAEQWSLESAEERAKKEATASLIHKVQPNSTIYVVREATRRGGAYYQLHTIDSMGKRLMDITHPVGILFGGMQQRNGRPVIYRRNGDMGMIEYNLAVAVSLNSDQLRFQVL